jgi:hypothetical protein
MEKKFVLTEEESKRILTLHKKKIQEERDEIQEADPTATWGYGALTLGISSLAGYDKGTSYDKVKRVFYKCSLGENNKPTLNGAAKDNYARAIYASITGGGTDEDKLFYTFSQIKTLDDLCAISRVYQNRYNESLWNALDGDLDKESDWYGIWKSISKLKVRVSQSQDETTTSKCPKIEKWFKDNGFVMITKQRYYQLANDNTRIRKYKYCPISKTNLFFAKVKGDTQGDGGETGPVIGGGGGRGDRYGFDYQEALKALKSKGCSVVGGGGGSQDEEQFTDDWSATKEQPVDTKVSQDDFKNWSN